MSNSPPHLCFPYPSDANANSKVKYINSCIHTPHSTSLIGVEYWTECDHHFRNYVVICRYRAQSKDFKPIHFIDMSKTIFLPKGAPMIISNCVFFADERWMIIFTHSQHFYIEKIHVDSNEITNDQKQTHFENVTWWTRIPGLKLHTLSSRYVIAKDVRDIHHLWYIDDDYPHDIQYTNLNQSRITKANCSCPSNCCLLVANKDQLRLLFRFRKNSQCIFSNQQQIRNGDITALGVFMDQSMYKILHAMPGNTYAIPIVTGWWNDQTKPTEKSLIPITDSLDVQMWIVPHTHWLVICKQWCGLTNIRFLDLCTEKLQSFDLDRYFTGQNVCWFCQGTSEIYFLNLKSFILQSHQVLDTKQSIKTFCMGLLV